ncbi:restriction endonuclease subunit S [Shewanella algicola]|uniref:restriction endonuclease subunit S n=1 Tax=Shewanella algicola TaxID=640633 RepID=UPI002493E672|nr:restriction endonuclease subunit S [Shewanella algicola]
MSFDNLPRGWQLIPLEDAMDAIIDYRGKTPKKTESGIPLITAKIVKGGYVLEPFEFIAENNYDSWMVRGLPQVGDVVLTTEAPLGETAQLTSANVALAQRIVTLRGKNGLLDSDFLLCALQSDFVQHQLESRASGSTVKGIKQSELRKVSLPIPPLAEQRKISQVLKSLSNKLVCNTQTNQTLEEMAQAIFKSWFVDFDPVKAKMNGEEPEGMDAATASLFPEKLVESELGLIPEGWEVKTLGEISAFQNGYAFKSKELTTDVSAGTHKVFKMGNIRKGGGFNWHGSKDHFDLNSNPKLDRYLIKKGDLLMSMTDMKNNVALLGHTALMPISDVFLVNQRVGLIRKSDKHYLNYPFLYYQTNETRFLTDIRSRANSGVQVNLSTAGIKETLLVVPPKEVHAIFDRQIRSYLEMMFSNDAQSEELAKLRDLLLPKLLSGEIDLVNED